MFKSDPFVNKFFSRYPDEDQVKADENPFFLIHSSVTRPESGEYLRENYPFTGLCNEFSVKSQ